MVSRFNPICAYHSADLICKTHHHNFFYLVCNEDVLNYLMFEALQGLI